MDYYGIPTYSIENQFLHAEVLEKAGPRLVRLSLAGSQENLLAETPDLSWETPYGRFHMYGGHRLWHAPEVPRRTYVPDDESVEIKDMLDGVRITGPVEQVTNIQKSVELHLHPDSTALTLVHRLQNHGAWQVELSPWAITQLPIGGVLVLPQWQDILDNQFLPNRQITLWHYSRINDPRLELHDDFILVYPNDIEQPFKIGYLNRHGWIGYIKNNTCFVKCFNPRAEQAYPDFGCNVEIYTNHRFVEMETLGPLARLQPGETVEHTEIWEIYTDLDLPLNLDGARQLGQVINQ